jgi:hypothetical protein
MDARRIEGKAVAGLVALLAVLVAAGGGNYVRNLEADEASESTRPFHAYDRDDLVSLRAAYEAEAASLQQTYEKAKGRRTRTGSSAMMDQAVADFERVRAQSDGLRELTAEIAEREARIRDIDKELAARAEIGEGWQAHLRRLTRI